MKGNHKMRTGLLWVRLYVRESRSLKDKRRIVKSIKDKLKNRFNVSVAEVGGLNNRQVAELGVAAVSNDGGHAQSVLAKVVSFIRLNPFADLTESTIEIL